MRDNHECMIEPMDAFERERNYFAIVEHKARRFQFGVSLAGYRKERIEIPKVMRTYCGFNDAKILKTQPIWKFNNLETF